MSRFVKALFAAAFGAAILSCGDSHPLGPDPEGGPSIRPDAISSEGAAGPTITTDRLDYAPGDTVIITGAGWRAHESISLLLSTDSLVSDTVAWNVTADTLGAFEDRTFQVRETDLGRAFQLIATGAASADTAQGMFTDADLQMKTNFGIMSVNLKYFAGSATCGGSPDSTVTGKSVGTTTVPVYRSMLPTNGLLVFAMNPPNGMTFVNWTAGGAGGGLTETTMLACFHDVRTWTANFAYNTTTAVTSDSVSPEIAGAPITFTATVTKDADNSAVSVDKVKFYDGGTDCAAGAGTPVGNASGVNLSSAGAASVTTSTLASGTHTIRACFQGSTAGDPDILASSGTMSFTITAASVATTTGVDASPASQSEFGSSVTFTATVTQTSGGAAVTTGNVAFKENSCAGSELQAAAAVNGSGQKTYTTSSLAVGVHTVAACYEGASGFDASNGSASYTINKIATSTGVSADKTSPQPAGTSITFTASVTRTTGGAAVDVGNVRFIEGGTCASPTTVLKTATAVNGSGEVTYATSALAVGSHTIVACYDGDTNYDISTGSMGFAIDSAATVVTVTPNPASPSEFGTSTTFTAAVTSGGNPVPAGYVRFVEGTCDVPTATLQLATAVNGSGEVALTTSSLSIGSHTVRACYDGTATYATSTGTTTYTISKIATGTEVTTNLNSPQNVGAPVTFTATVTRTTGGAAVTTGNVRFIEGGSCTAPTTTLQGATAVDGSGQVTFSGSGLAAGAHDVVACYDGTTTYEKSEDTRSFTFNLASTSTIVTPSPSSPSEFGTSVTFTAAVTSGGNAVGSGNVRFIEGGSCASPTATLKTATAVNGSGEVAYTTTTLAVGSHTIVACYDGTGSYDTSSGSAGYTIDKIGTATSLTHAPSGDSHEFGTEIVFTAEVNRTTGGADVNQGNIAFYEGGTCSSVGSPLQPSGAVDSDGKKTYTVSNLAVGPHSIIACYEGTTTYQASDDDAAITVTKIGTSTSVTVLPSSPQIWGTSLTFTAEVNRTVGGSDVSDGQLAFYDGGTSCASPGPELQAAGALDSNGKKTLTISTLDVGSHTVRACYLGNDTLAASNGSVPFTVNKIPTTVTLSLSPSISQQYSDSVTLSAAVVPNSIPGSVQFMKSVSGGSYTNLGSAVTVLSGAASTRYKVEESSTMSLSFKAVFTPDDIDHVEIDDDTKGLTVAKEDAKVSFDGSNYAAKQVTAPGGTADGASFIVHVREKSPDVTGPGVASGDIGNVTGLSASLSPISGGSGYTLTCNPGPVSGTGYTKELSYTCSTNASLPVNTYQLDVSVNGDYYTGSDTDAFTVYDPSLGFATGGGTYNLGGDKVNFGFTMKYTKSGTNLQGNMIAVRHHADGTVSRIKSNSLGGLAITDTNTGCGVAQFSGKATYTTWSASINDYVNTGNNTFYVYAKDCNNPGTGTDSIWIDGPGNLDMSGNGESGKVSLTGGNIAVPHKPAK